VSATARTRRVRARWPAAVAAALFAAGAAALEPVDPDAGPEARALLELLAGLPERASARVLTGQTIHGDLEAQYERYVEGYQRLTGRYPALLQLMVYAHWLTERDHPIAHRSDASLFPLGYNHANAGGVLMWLYNPNNPYTGGGSTTLIPDGRLLQEAYTPGTDAHAVWREDLEMLAVQARRMERAGIPVIVRMFGEYNNLSPRWQNVRPNPTASWEDFKAAWRFAVGTVREAGAHNLLWCLEEADGPRRYRLLGWQEDWVDVNGLQAFHDETTTGPLDLYTAFRSNSAKPILYGQFLLKDALRSNPPSYHYDRAIDLVRDTMPAITAIVPWSVHQWGDPEDLREHSPVFHYAAREYADDPWTVHRGELDLRFGRPGRAPLPIRSASIAVSGPWAEGFDADGPGAGSWEPGANGSIQRVFRDAGLLHAFYFGRNPILRRANLDMPAEFDRLRLRLRNHTLAEEIQLSWKRAGDESWSAERRIGIPVEPMGLYLQEHRVDLSRHPSWNGTIAAVRLHLNPGRVWGSAEIDFVKFDRAGGEPQTTLQNGGFERSLGVGWRPHHRGESGSALARYDVERRGGEHAGLVYLRDHPADGIRQDVTGLLRALGPGRYRFGGHLKLPETSPDGTVATGRVLVMLRTGGDRRYFKSARRLSERDWRRLAGEADLDWDGELDEALLIVSTSDSVEDLLVDDVYLRRSAD
jgi:hypothetical protein